MATEMTEQDMVDGRKFADRIIEMFDGVRPPVAVSGISIALAAASVLAQCGPNAPVLFFRHFYKVLGGPEADSTDARRSVTVDEEALMARRMRVGQVLGDQGLISLTDFAALSLEKRHELLDAVITAVAG